jgi:predicted enzyme related to lactoylglutathione lyase
MATFKESPVMAVIAVDDLERAVAFYRDKLGLEVEETGDPDSSYLKADRESGILLYKSTFKRGETTVASFLVADITSAVDELRTRGVVFEEYDFPGLKTEHGIATAGRIRASWFKDSEGNIIAVTEDKEALARHAA